MKFVDDDDDVIGSILISETGSLEVSLASRFFTTLVHNYINYVFENPMIILQSINYVSILIENSISFNFGF